jgi:transcriptional regulator with XRE-family HTH domain
MLPESEIGPNIRKIRKSKKLTLDELATQSGISKGYLSKVENSEKSPPVSTLINIAKGLGVAISDLFGESRGIKSSSVVRKDDRQVMARDGTIFGYFYETLAHNYPHKKMEPYILTIPVHKGKEAVFQHEGEEMLLMLKGRMNFRVGGKEDLLEEGDCIYFDSGLAHGGTVIGEEEVKCLIVIFTP